MSKSIFKVIEKVGKEISKELYKSSKHAYKDMLKNGKISKDVYKALKHDAKADAKLMEFIVKHAEDLFD